MLTAWAVGPICRSRCGLRSTPGRPLPALDRVADARATRVALRGLGLVLFAGFLVVAWLGSDDNGTQNPAPTWFYVWFWVGMVPASLLLGPVWCQLNPLRPLSGAARALLRVRPRALPDRLG